MNDKFKNSSKFFINTPTSVGQMVIIYTMLVVLSEMRKTLGIEAVLEYISKSKDHLEKDNKALKESVYHALTRINIENIYKDASNEEDFKV